MLCDKCKKSFDKPLELFTGNMACPHCRKIFELSSIKLAVTDDNEELFTMSEICYLRALKTSATQKDEYKRLLNKAISLCKSAATAGHPKALVRYGYFYDAGYFPADSTEAFKMACDYYRTVWSGDITDLRTKGDMTEYADGGLKIRKIAASLYLEHMKNAPKSLLKYNRYNYETAVDEIKRANLYDKAASFAGYKKSEDRAAHAAEVLQSCYSRERAPLFGLLYLDSRDFAELAEKREDIKNGTRAFLARYAEKMYLCMFNADKDDYQVIKSARDYSKITEGNYYLYFFNTNGSHKLRGGAFTAIKNCLERSGPTGEFEKIADMIAAIGKSGDMCDYIFHDDDILVYKSKAESYAHATGDFFNSFIEYLK